MCTTCGCSDTNEVIVTDAQTGATMTMAREAGAMHAHADGTVHSHEHDHDHDHRHDHDHDHDHHHHHHHDDDHGHQHAHDHEHAAHSPGTTIALEQAILAKNQLLAERNRGWLAGREILALNLVSSPGSGKTALLERTLRDLKGGTRSA